VGHRLIAVLASVVLGLVAAVLLSKGAVVGKPGTTPAMSLATADQATPWPGATESWDPLGPSPSSAAGSPAPTASEAPRSAAIALGYFIPGAASDPGKIDEFGTMVGTSPRVVMWYQRWSDAWSDFSPRTADAIRARGAMPMISWEPTAGPVQDATWSLRRITDGSHDGYIRRWVKAVAAWGHELYVRPMYEMNGWWASWCAYANGNSPKDFIAAWRHIVDLAREAGATNIRWVWAPNVDNDGLGVPFDQLYPGDDYVDWVGLDGFNRGTSWSSTHWQNMVEIFGASITHVREITQKPLMIAETGSSEVGGDKAAWIRKSLARIPQDLPDVRAVIWFSKNETSLGIDWRVNSSAASLQAFRDLAGSAPFSGRLP
jgi:hypothetical protein